MTAFKKAWGNFKESDEYHDGTDPTTIGAPSKQRVYLENRINRAFAAGWNAAILERRFTVQGSGSTSGANDV